MAYDHDGRATAAFRERWLDFVGTWSAASRHRPGQARELVRTALDRGLPSTDDPGDRHSGNRAGVTASEEHQCSIALIRASGAFDGEGYHRANRPYMRLGTDPLVHFVTLGWRQLRAPSLGFDLWWYWTEHLDPRSEDVNPLIHFLVAGRHSGLSPLPAVESPREPTRLEPGAAVRRICLFAAYDEDGLVDDYVVDYLTELGRFADIYYLADGVMDEAQLRKLDGIVQQAWAIPHRAYDFGSYSLLARDLVGWPLIEEYDELILANDSCFRLQPLDAVFAKMDARACDWWSLQATSHDFEEDDLRMGAPLMPLEEAKKRFIPPRQWSDVNYLHLSSYLLAFRRPVVQDTGFRRRLDTVAGQRDKVLVIHKYEVGISRYLMDSGFDFNTFVDHLYPFHPLYGARFFDLVELGFPLVKRNFLAENPRNVPDLAQWRSRLASLVPDAPFDLMERNIGRVAPDDRLQRANAVTADRDGRPVVPAAPVSGRTFGELDAGSPTFDHWWAFPVGPSGYLGSSARAVFEVVKDDPSIRKVVLTGARRLTLTGENVTLVPLTSGAGQQQLARCGHFLVEDTPRAAISLPLPRRLHRFIHLGSGLPLTPYGVAAPAEDDEAREALAADFERLQTLVTSSRAGAVAVAAGAHPLPADRLWVTGLPRHDLLLASAADLPDDIRADEERLRELVGDRRLLLFQPTAVHCNDYLMADDELRRLAGWCDHEQAVLGVRDPVSDRSRTVSRHLASIGALDLSARHFPYAESVLRVAAAMVTDTDGDAADFLLTGRPLLHLAPEREDRREVPVGCLDLAETMPGPVCVDVAALLTAFETVFELPSAQQQAAYLRARRLCFDHTDGRSARRVANRVRGLYAG